MATKRTTERWLRAILKGRCDMSDPPWERYLRWLEEQEHHPIAPDVIAGTDANFLRSVILDDPDDDLPRLAYADWLAKYGDPDLAEFIQAQIGLHRAKPEDSRTSELDARQRTLLKANRRRWCRSVSPGILEGTFIRGLPHGVRMTARSFLFHARRLFSVAPVERLSLVEVLPVHVWVLVYYPWTSRLKALDLSGNRIDSETAGVVASSPYLRRVESLDLSGSLLPDVYLGVEDLCEGVGNLPSLTDLRLGNCEVGPEGIRDLAGSDLLGQLTSLHLNVNPIGEAGAASLAGTRRASKLVSLDLSQCGIGDGGAVALGRSPHLANLKIMNLSSNAIGDAGARALLGGRLASLESLSLGNNLISPAVAQEVRRRFGKDSM